MQPTYSLNTPQRNQERLMQQYWQHDFAYTDKLFRNGTGSEDFFRSIEKELSPVVSRAELARIIGGLISAKTLRRMRSPNSGATTASRQTVFAGKARYTRYSPTKRGMEDIIEKNISCGVGSVPL